MKIRSGILAVGFACSLAPLVSVGGDDPGRIALPAAAAKPIAERLVFDKGAGALIGAMRSADQIDWAFDVDRAGWYQIVVHYALANDSLKGKGQFEAAVVDQIRLGPIHATGAAERILPQVLFDPIELNGGSHRLVLKVRNVNAPLELRIEKVELVRAREPGTF